MRNSILDDLGGVDDLGELLLIYGFHDRFHSNRFGLVDWRELPIHKGGAQSGVFPIQPQIQCAK